MNTFILRWNPAISSYKMERHLEIVSHAHKMQFPESFDWSVRDWQKVKDGDMAVLLQVGTENDGVAMIAKIVGAPEADESWRGDGSKVHYVNLSIFDAFNPAEQKQFRAENFESDFETIKWHKGHSGELIDKATAKRLFEKLNSAVRQTGDIQQGMLDAFIEHGWLLMDSGEEG